ncbi:tetratricopeptide repeat protein [Dactylosporangium sp. NPDC051541]|uniref:AfsR/SARP family transcriptional regulator n=1 Tax=Dactylosporangium sp. NPDC051541 TaxID=3363977 RepID=UPI0037938E87
MREVVLRLLGPVELRVDGHDVPLGPARQRTVLAALAVDAGRPVPVETLIDRVWDDEPPDGVRSGLYSYITRLRRALGGTGGRIRLHRGTTGYVLSIDSDDVDLLRFNRLARAGAGHAAEAMAIWREPVLGGLSGTWVSLTRQQTLQRYLDVVLTWAAAHVREGRPGEVLDTLRALQARHPLVEPLAALLIEALQTAGRTAEALECFAAVRRHLVDELGAEPGPRLRALHAGLLRAGAPEVTTAAAGRGGALPAVPATAARGGALPADTGAFTGRAREIEQLTAAAGGDGRRPVVHAISGMPGVGKTVLAVHVAHRLRDAYPHGHVFVDLHAHTAGQPPADPGDVLGTLLAADGVDPRRLPAGTEARSALWRARLAGRRVLLVLDNAADSGQVAPLLPGSGGCLVLVTSRRFLGDLPVDAVPVPLDVLAADEAERMFRRLAPHADAPPGPVAELVAACGRLPLAVSLLARVLSRHRGWTVDDLLRETRTRLLDVAAEHASVAAAFGLSYRHLPDERRRIFRRLAGHPGTELEPYAAAALAGISRAEAAGQLDALHADSLLTEVGYHRYAMHDLIRSYAAALAATDPAEERAGALERLIGLYQRTAARADAHLTRRSRPAARAHDPGPGNPGPDEPGFVDAGDALRWLRTERANLRACLAAVAGDPARTVALTAGLTELLRRDGPWTEALTLHEAAVVAAEGLEGGVEHAGALVDVATIRRLGGDYEGAARDCRLALERYRAAGSPLGEANALTGLGKALARAADYTGAAAVVQRALVQYRRRDDVHGEAGALVELAVAQGMMSDFLGAQELLGKALRLYRELGDVPGQAYALRILGIAHGRVGDFAGARACLEEALGLYRELGGRLGQALTLTDLGRVATGLGDHAGAIGTLRAALERHRELEHVVGQSTALLYLGGALRRAGDRAGAEPALDEALELNRGIGNRSGEAMVLNELGAVYRLNGFVERAATAHRQALELARGVPSPWDQAQSLAGIGRCAVARGRRRAAKAQLREALDILQRISAAEAAEVAADLGAL